MSNLTHSEYWKEINDTAYTLVEEAVAQVQEDNSEIEDFSELKELAEEIINDSLLNETVDSHHWVIYHAYNLDVVAKSNNEDYMLNNMGAESLEISLKEGGLNGLHAAVAYWCMYADIQENLESAFSEFEEDQEA